MNSPKAIALTLASAAFLLCVLCPVLSGVAYTLFQEIVYPASQPAPVVASADTGEAEYYRGVYDTCVYIYTGTGSSDGEAVTACNGLELWDSDPMTTYTSLPPQKSVKCPACGYRGFRVA